jgi:multidrug efflux system membrane fusion protein
MSSNDVTVLALDRDNTTQLGEGKLAVIDNQIDTTTGTVKLRALFQNENESLFPNQFVNVKLLVDTISDATIAPAAAVLVGAPGPYVYIANPDATVSARPVKLGPEDGDRVAIREGLAPGDKVVVDGVDRLRDGVKIRVRGSDDSHPANGVKNGREGDAAHRQREQK